MKVTASSFKAYDIRGVVGETIDEVFADPQVEHLHLVSQVAHPTEPSSTIGVLRHPVTMSATPVEVRGGPHRRGSDTDAVLAELGYTESEMAALSPQP